jgi:hypothetical protein
MISLLKILEEHITSIPVHNISKSARKVYELFKKQYPNVPEYVIMDFLNNKDYSKFSEYEILKILSEIPDYVSKKYDLRILYVNPMDFTDSTIDWFIERNFGDTIELAIPGDEERTKRQRLLSRSDGKNEPIVVLQHNNGKYELLEGWHRTMSILKLGDNGEDLKNWNKVKIRAFVSKK